MSTCRQWDIIGLGAVIEATSEHQANQESIVQYQVEDGLVTVEAWGEVRAAGGRNCDDLVDAVVCGREEALIGLGRRMPGEAQRRGYC